MILLADVDPGPWAAWLSIVAIIGGIVMWFVRRELVRFRSDIVSEVAAKTKQIQPEANGGKSLTDLHAKVDLISTLLVNHVNDDEAHIS